MNIPSEEFLDSIKRRYPIGSRVKLVKMDDAQAPPIGTLGNVVGVDGLGSIRVNWDNGSSLSIIYGEDIILKVG